MLDSSRGNTVVAALLLVTLVGVGAITLDSVSIKTNPHALVAEVGSLEQRGGSVISPQALPAPGLKSADASQKPTKCEPGFDYNIKVEGGQPIPEKRQPIQCRTIAQATYVGSQNILQSSDGRQCHEVLWKCKLWYCLADSLRRPSLKGSGFSDRQGETNGCIEIRNKTIPAGAELKVDDADITGQIGSETASAYSAVLGSDATKEQKTTAQMSVSEITASKSPLGTAVSQAFDGKVTEQRDMLDNAMSSRDAANNKLLSCVANNQGAVSLCPGPQKELTVAEAEVKKQEQKLASLNSSAQSLGGQWKSITPAAQVDPAAGGTCLGSTDPNNCRLSKGCPLPWQTRDAAGNCPSSESSCPGGNCSRFPGERVPVASGGGQGGLFSSLGNTLRTLGTLAAITNAAVGLQQAIQGTQSPSCTLTASPTNITQAGQAVTLSWTSRYAQQAQLSNVGAVGPSGSMQIQPQQTTTYFLQVVGYPQQQQQPYNPYNPYAQQQGQYVWNPYTNSYTYAQPQMMVYGGYGGVSGGGAPSYGSCQVQVTVGAQTPTAPVAQQPAAQISCQPQIVEVGMQVGISYACQNSAASSGSGFATNGALFGNATTSVLSPTLGSNTQTFGLTCSKEGVVDSAQCTVQVNKPSIVLVANPKEIKSGETSNIGWVTGGMESCVISSGSLTGFTQENAGNASPSGVAKTPVLTQNTQFVLSCTTKAGSTKSASTTVKII